MSRKSVRTMLAQKAPVPDVGDLLRRLEEVTGTHGSRARLAELMGVAATTVWRWEHGGKPSLVHAEHLRELDRRLQDRKISLNDELLGVVLLPDTTQAPLFVATAVTVTIDGAQTLLRFSIKVPGEASSRSLVDVLIPSAALARVQTRAV